MIAFEFTTVLLFTYPPPPHTQYRDVGITMGFPGGSGGKASTCNAEDPGSIPRSGRSPREGNGNALQYSYLENPWTEEPGGLQSIRSQSHMTERLSSSSSSYLYIAVSTSEIR